MIEVEPSQETGGTGGGVGAGIYNNNGGNGAGGLVYVEH